MNNEKKAPVRQIKFRGLRVDGKGWVYGDFFDTSKSSVCKFLPTIIENGGMNPIDFHLVKPDSIGQFTGLLDKNGKDVYDGDMVLASMKYKGVTLMPFRAYVFYNESVGSWQIKYETTTNNFATDFTYSYEIEIVGHIHEEREVSNG